MITEECLKNLCKYFSVLRGKNVNETRFSSYFWLSIQKQWDGAVRGWTFRGENINTMAYMKVDGWLSGGGWLKKTFLLLSVLDACFSAANTKIYIFVCWIKFIQEFVSVWKRPRPISTAARRVQRQELRKLEAALQELRNCESRKIEWKYRPERGWAKKCASYFNWMRSETV